MALITADRVFEVSTTTGTSDLTLSGALTGYRTFSSVCANNDTAYYTLWEVDNAGLPTGAWETGLGTFLTGGTLQRTTVSASSTGSKLVLAAGTKRVALGLTAAQINGLQPALVSGTNIKTVNSTSLLGSGDVTVQPALVSGTNIKTVNSTSLLGSGDVAVQPTLVSGTNIKTVNTTSLLGSGDVTVQPTLVSGTNIKTVNGTSLLGSGNIVTGTGDVSGPASSVDDEIALFSGTGGKTLKRSTATGILKASSGVLSAAVSGTDVKTVDGVSILGSGNITTQGAPIPSYLLMAQGII